MELIDHYTPAGTLCRALSTSCSAAVRAARLLGGERLVRGLSRTAHTTAARLACEVIARIPGFVAACGRGSALSGEALLGKSDVDLVLALADGLSRTCEGEAILEMQRRMASFRRFVPALSGHASIWTLGELRPQRLCVPSLAPRETYWPLAGRVRGPLIGPPGPATRRIGATVRWYSEIVRKGDAEYLAWKTDGVASAVADLAARLGPTAPDLPLAGRERTIVASYSRTLRLMEAACELADEKLEGRLPAGQYRSVAAEHGRPRTYVVVGSADERTLGPALDRVVRDPEVEVYTPGALKFMLGASRPTEVAAMRRMNPGLGLSPPGRTMMLRYWHWCAQPRFFRSPLPSSPDGPSMCRLAAGARLYLDRGIVPATPTEMRRAYADAYGEWPFMESRDAGVFYRREYPKLWEVADRVYELLAAEPEGRTETVP